MVLVTVSLSANLLADGAEAVTVFLSANLSTDGAEVVTSVSEGVNRQC